MDYEEYYKDREKKKALGYRLKRRTKEVIKAILKYKERKVKSILDVGCADGKMLEFLLKELKVHDYKGVDFDQKLINLANEDIKKHLEVGNALNLRFKDNNFDVLISTAVIEHLENPEKFLKESYRVLKEGGIIILTTPSPLFEKLGTLVGHLKDETHFETYNLKELKSLLRKNGFRILESKRFMISPMGMPFEIPIENSLNKIGLHWIMCNQLIVGKK